MRQACGRLRWHINDNNALTIAAGNPLDADLAR
jgi:hypothetical protein